MTIYTTAARVAKHGVCEGGTERTAAALAREGKTMDTVVTMQNILHSLGLTDALFSLCEVEPGSERERDKVLGKYMRLIGSRLNIALQAAYPNEQQLRSIAGEADGLISKRSMGHKREAYARRVTVGLLRERQQRDDPRARYWLQGLVELLSTKPDYLAVTHATVAFVEGYRITGEANRVTELLAYELNDILEWA